MWVHWGLREEEEIRGMLVQHRNDVDQGGAVGPCFLSVDGEEFELRGRRRRVKNVTRSCVPVCPNKGREIG